MINDLDIIPIFRMHLPEYNEAAWVLEGSKIYPEYRNFEEYCRIFEEIYKRTNRWLLADSYIK